MDKTDKAQLAALITTPDTTVGGVSARVPEAKAGFDRLGFDSCCGGRRTLRASLAEKAITNEQLIEGLEQAENYRLPDDAFPTFATLYEALEVMKKENE